MKTHVRVLVIGGGVVGVSTLYHLTKKGWKDVALIERTELTAGSTWHAAGLLPLFNMSYTVGQLHKYSVDLYKRLPERDRAGHQLPRHRQPAPGDQPRAHGRVPEVLRHGQHHRRALRSHHAQAREGTVAAAGTGRQRRDAGDHRGAVPPGRWPHCARRPHHGAAQGRTRRRRGDLRAHRGAGVHAHGGRGVAGAHLQGRHHRRAPGACHRQLRAPDRQNARPERAGDPGRAPVHRLRRVAGT